MGILLLFIQIVVFFLFESDGSFLDAQIIWWCYYFSNQVVGFLLVVVMLLLNQSVVLSFE